MAVTVETLEKLERKMTLTLPVKIDRKVIAAAIRADRDAQ